MFLKKFKGLSGSLPDDQGGFTCMSIENTNRQFKICIMNTTIKSTFRQKKTDQVLSELHLITC